MYIQIVNLTVLNFEGAKIPIVFTYFLAIFIFFSTNVEAKKKLFPNIFFFPDFR